MVSILMPTFFGAFLKAYKTKVSRNANMAKLQASYLFPEVCHDSCIFFAQFLCPFISSNFVCITSEFMLYPYSRVGNLHQVERFYLFQIVCHSPSLDTSSDSLPHMF
ncbi:unnamed protein product [Ilex paraguariensis]|uniref:Uncharacterized protein n=1 Tax=Ilex paraguariensis TaxID=185542 RepID=A0ABC8SGT7_9AQUA